MEVVLNLYEFIKEEGVCSKLGCFYNDLGICECMDTIWQHDIRMKSSDLLESKYPKEIMYTCFMARPKVGLCLHCGKELDYWKEDSGEEWTGCNCQD